MDAYFDSGVIVKLYVNEASSAGAIQLVRAYTPPYCLTEWQSLEVRNAIRLKTFRREITAAEMVQSIAAFDQDVSYGRWLRPDYSLGAVEQKTAELSASHTVALGCRALDIIHVAVAVVVGTSDFVTFDKRQAALARTIGLTVKS